MLIEEMNITRLERGAAAFWWLGQLGYAVKVGDLVLYFDPFLAPSTRRKVPPLLRPDEVTNASWVFGSHDHGDHIDPVALPGIAAASPGARFVCSRVARAKLLSLGIPEGRIVALDEGLVLEEQGLRVSPIAAKHEFFDRDPQEGFPYLSFVVEANGVTIYHSGDTLCYEGMLTKLAQWQFDLFFMCINGRDAARYTRNCIGNMTYQEAVDLAGTLRPRMAVPGHYEMFEGNTEDPQLFADYMQAKYPDVAFWIGEHGTRVVLMPSDQVSGGTERSLASEGRPQ
jgi:L-ascorbate metabolism protein UlaG (beta-lactamase superfamily)